MQCKRVIDFPHRCSGTDILIEALDGEIALRYARRLAGSSQGRSRRTLMYLRGYENSDRFVSAGMQESYR